MRPLLALVVMVKNEADSIRAVLESALPHVDCALVMDTGSTDGTQDIVRECLGAREAMHQIEIGPVLHRLRSGRDVFHYAANRNAALGYIADVLEDEERPVFTLFLSGHETLRGGAELRRALEAERDETDGAYSIRIESGTRAFGYTRVLRVDAGWRYAGPILGGAIHERPESPDGDVEADGVVPGVISHAPPESDIDRKIARIRETDLPVIEEAAEDEAVPLERRAEAIRMLGETNALLASECLRLGGPEAKKNGGPWLTHQMVAMSCLFRYAVLAEPVDPEMAHYSLALYYHLAGDVEWMYGHEELFHRLKTFTELAPESAEAKFLLAKHAVLTDPRLGLPHALEAAKAAKATRDKMRRAPFETSLVWRALLMAARCAEEVAGRAKSKEEQVMKQAQARRWLTLAVQEGAPKELLEKSKEKAAEAQS